MFLRGYSEALMSTFGIDSHITIRMKSTKVQTLSMLSSQSLVFVSALCAET